MSLKDLSQLFFTEGFPYHLAHHAQHHGSLLLLGVGEGVGQLVPALQPLLVAQGIGVYLKMKPKERVNLAVVVCPFGFVDCQRFVEAR
jgi:hypothetical protein